MLCSRRCSIFPRGGYIENTKKCNRCLIEKSLDCFSKDKSKRDGLQTLCKICRNNYQFEYKKTESSKKSRSQYRKRYPLKLRANRTNKRARDMGISGTLTDTELSNKLASQDNRCNYCKIFINVFDSITYHIDHIVPLSNSGTNDISNIQILCSRCNFAKLDGSHEEMLEWIERLKRDHGKLL